MIQTQQIKEREINTEKGKKNHLPGPAVRNGVHSIDHTGGEGLDGGTATPQS